MSSHAITLNKSWPAHLIRNLKINLDDYLERHSVGIIESLSRSCVTKCIKIELVGTGAKLSETVLFANDSRCASASRPFESFL